MKRQNLVIHVNYIYGKIKYKILFFLKEGSRINRVHKINVNKQIQ